MLLCFSGRAVVPYRLHASEQEGWGDVLREGGALRNLAFREACSHGNAGPWHPDLGAALWKDPAGPHCEPSASLLSCIQNAEIRCLLNTLPVAQLLVIVSLACAVIAYTWGGQGL